MEMALSPGSDVMLWYTIFAKKHSSSHWGCDSAGGCCYRFWTRLHQGQWLGSVPTDHQYRCHSKELRTAIRLWTLEED